MRIEKINEDQIRFTLTSEDLVSRKLAISELATGSDKAQRLFHEMLQKAFIDYGFEVSGNTPMMVEIRASSPNDLAITVTKVKEKTDVINMLGKIKLSPTELSFDEPNSANCGFGVFRFRNLCEATSAAKAIGKACSLKNTLFKSEDFNNYQLLLFADPEKEEEFDRVCELLSEYGLQLNAVSSTEAYFKEHCSIILKDNALQQLSLL